MALPSTGIGKMLRQGRSDLPGPLTNYATNVDASMTVIAAHPANHAGASGGRSMGPLPTTTLFNKRVLGNEIVYPGFVPMHAGQYRTAAIWARIVADVVGYGDIQRVRAHAETSITGKWDPGFAPGQTIDMAAFRAAAFTAQGADMPLTEADLINNWSFPLRSAWDPNLKRRADDWLSMAAGSAGNVENAVAGQILPMLAQIIAGQQDDLDAEAVLARVDTAVRESTATAINTTILPAIARIEAALAADDASEAKAIVAELGERLRSAA
jgi:hypothetical protein